MKLELDALDLKIEHQKRSGVLVPGNWVDIDQNISTEEVTFDKLNAHAQTAVLAVGKGIFRSFDNRTQKEIFPIL